MGMLPPSHCGLNDARRLACRAVYVAGLLFVLLALVTPGACLPHSHSGVGAGIYNEDHDLGMFAASGSAAALPISVPLFVDVVVALLCVSARSVPVSLATRDAESRAPPAA
jgi:hypothetical protein